MDVSGRGEVHRNSIHHDWSRHWLVTDSVDLQYRFSIRGIAVFLFWKMAFQKVERLARRKRLERAGIYAGSSSMGPISETIWSVGAVGGFRFDFGAHFIGARFQVPQQGRTHAGFIDACFRCLDVCFNHPFLAHYQRLNAGLQSY